MIKRLFSFKFLTWLAILILAAIVGWVIVKKDRTETGTLKTLQETSEKQQQALEQITSILTTHDQQFKQVAEHSNQLLSGLKELDTLVRGDNQAWRLMQVQNFLEMAMVHATLLNDTTTAINLLAAADNGLKAIHNPNLLPVRQALQADINMLANQPSNNIPTIILHLEAIAEMVPNLPHKIQLHKEFKTDEDQAQTSGSKWEQRANEAWQELKSLVRIRRHDEPVTPYFSQDDIWLINENMSLILEQASFAAARHYSVLYKQEIKHAQDWVKQYYDANDPNVQQVTQTLAQLAQLPVASNTNLHLKTVDAWATFITKTKAGEQ